MVEDDDRRTYTHRVGEIFSIPAPFLGGKHPFFKGEHLIFMGKQSFHKRDAIFNSFADYFVFFGGGGGGFEEAQVFGEKLPHLKVDRALSFPLVFFEPASTEIAPQSPNHWAIQSCK